MYKYTDAKPAPKFKPMILNVLEVYSSDISLNEADRQKWRLRNSLCINFEIIFNAYVIIIHSVRCFLKCYNLSMNVFFSGIGGVGIGPLAEIALDAGYTVVGSDMNPSVMTDLLISKGVEIKLGNQDGSFLEEQNKQKSIDIYVYTSALSENHPELLKAKELGIKTSKRDELLATIIKQKNQKLVAVSGTHGKTTTTGMMIWAMQQLKIPVSYSIGTTISFGPSGLFNPNSEYFIYECDEFDRNFLSFNPEIALVTSIDYDHPDTYPDEQDYFDAFRQFGERSKKIICWQDQHSELFDDDKSIKLNKNMKLDISLPGKHNRENAQLVVEALKIISPQSELNVLQNFPGTNRRFEKIAHNLFSDYGHHPIEIKATLQMAKEISDEVVLVYQPHQNIRQHYIKNEYTDQFEDAAKIYWLPTYLSREDPNLPILNPSDLTENITNKNSIVYAEFNDELWNSIKAEIDKGRIVICMGAGDIDNWIRSRLNY